MVQIKDNNDECSSSCSEIETLTLLTKKISKFLKKKKGKDKSQPSKKYTKKVDNSSNFTSFGCGKQGHIKVECLNQSHKGKTPVEIRKG